MFKRSIIYIMTEQYRGVVLLFRDGVGVAPARVSVGEEGERLRRAAESGVYVEDGVSIPVVGVRFFDELVSEREIGEIEEAMMSGRG